MKQVLFKMHTNLLALNLTLNLLVKGDDNETVDLTFSAQIGAPNTTNQGIFYTGKFDGVVDARVQRIHYPFAGI